MMKPIGLYPMVALLRVAPLKLMDIGCYSTKYYSMGKPIEISSHGHIRSINFKGATSSRI